MNYKKFKQENQDCYIPLEWELNQAVASTPEYLRRWFNEN